MEPVDPSGPKNEELLGKGPAEGGAYLYSKPARIPFFLEWLTNMLAKEADVPNISLAEWVLAIIDGPSGTPQGEQGGPCGQVWHAGEFAYRCETCQTNESSAICMECFKAGDHNNHDFRLYQSIGGGSCDCGIKDAWKESGFCSVHRGNIVAAPLPVSVRPTFAVLARQLTLWIDAQGKPEARSWEVAKDICGLLFEIVRRGERYRIALCREFLAFDPAKFLASLPSVRANSTAFVDLLVEMCTHSDEELRFKCLEVFLAEFPHLLELEPPVSEAVQAVVDRLGSPLLNYRVSCETAAKKDILFPSLLGSMHALLLRNSHEDEASGDSKLNLESEIVQEQALAHFMTCMSVALAHPACAAALLLSKHYLTWLEATALLQGTVENRRREGEHVEYENDEYVFGIYHESWWTGLYADLLQPIGTPLIPPTPSALQAVFAPAHTRLRTWLLRQAVQPAISAAIPGSLFPDILSQTPRCSFVSTRHVTTFTLPLHRWVAALIRRLADLRLAPADMRKVFPVNTADLLALAVHPLRLQVLLGEVRADMWLKNGAQTMQGQIRHYVGFRAQTLELDLFLLQFVASFVPPEQFIVFTLEHFGLLRLLSHTLRTDAALTPEESVLLHDCLSLFLKLTLGHCLIGATEEEKLRREVIAWLACGDLPASRLVSRLSPEFRSAKATHKLDKVLSAVAQVTAPQSLTEEKLYRLKAECWAELDPYFWAYRSGDLQSVEDNYRQRASGGKKGVLPLNTNVAHLLPLFACLPSLLHSVVLTHLIRSVLFLFLEKKGVSESLLHCALHTILAALSIPSLPFVANAPQVQLPQQEPGFLRLVTAKGPDNGDSLLDLILRLRQPSVYPDLRDSIGLILTELRRDGDSDVRKRLEGLAEEDDEKRPEQKKKKAKEMQNAMLAAMAAQRERFLQLDTQMGELDDDDEEATNAAGKGKEKEETAECVVCKEQQSIRSTRRPLALVVSLQRTRLLPVARKLQLRAREETSASGPEGLKRREENNAEQSSVNADAAALLDTFPVDSAPPEHAMIAQFLGIPVSRQERAAPMDTPTEALASAELFRRTEVSQGLVLHSCGHSVHAECMQEALRARSEDVGDHRTALLSANEAEFYCPLCRQLGNALLPLIPDEILRGFEGGGPSALSAALSVPTAVVPPAAASPSPSSSSLPSFAEWLKALIDGDLLPALEDIRAEPFASALDALALRTYYVRSRHEASTSRSLHSRLASTLASDICALEFSLRGENAPYSALISSSRSLVLRSFYKSVFAFFSLSNGTAVRALADTVQGMFLQPNHNAIGVDPFLALLLWVLSHQQPLLPDNLFFMLRLVFATHLAQLSLCLRGSTTAPTRFTLPAPSPPPPLASISDLHIVLTGSTAPEDSAQIIASALPFLHRCALFVQCCLGVPLNGIGPSSSFNALCDALKLSLPATLCTNSAPDRTALLSVLFRLAFVSPSPALRFLPFTGTFQLTPLPEQFQELVFRYREMRCSSCGTAREPALCLLCGELLPKGRPCCDEVAHGSCFSHAMNCNGGQCIFLLVHTSATLFVRDERVCSGPSPYLDHRGEQDIGLRRGRSLQLSAARYAQLRCLVINASLDEQMLRGDAAQVTRTRNV